MTSPLKTDTFPKAAVCARPGSTLLLPSIPLLSPFNTPSDPRQLQLRCYPATFFLQKVVSCCRKSQFPFDFTKANHLLSFTCIFNKTDELQSVGNLLNKMLDKNTPLFIRLFHLPCHVSGRKKVAHKLIKRRAESVAWPVALCSETAAATPLLQRASPLSVRKCNRLKQLILSQVYSPFFLWFQLHTVSRSRALSLSFTFM